MALQLINDLNFINDVNCRAVNVLLQYLPLKKNSLTVHEILVVNTKDDI